MKIDSPKGYLVLSKKFLPDNALQFKIRYYCYQKEDE
jgi:hypothetical protein